MTKKLRNVWRALAAIGFIAGAAGLLVWLPEVMVQWTIRDPAQGGLDQPALTTAITANRQAVLFAIGGVIAVITLLISFSKHSLERDSNWTGRYTEAIAQLGEESLPIRLGGIYALERIAQDSLRDRQTILDVLCAFLRHSCPVPPAREAVVLPELGADISAAVAVIRRITLLSKPRTPVNLDGTRLGHFADFRDANFEGASLSKCLWDDANLSGANLRNADIHHTDLSGAKLRGVNLSGAQLILVELKQADMSKANLTGSRIFGTLEETKMWEAVINKADLSAAAMITRPGGGSARDIRTSVPLSRDYMVSRGVVGASTASFSEFELSGNHETVDQ